MHCILTCWPAGRSHNRRRGKFSHGLCEGRRLGTSLNTSHFLSIASFPMYCTCPTHSHRTLSILLHARSQVAYIPVLCRIWIVLPNIPDMHAACPQGAMMKPPHKKRPGFMPSLVLGHCQDAPNTSSLQSKLSDTKPSPYKCRVV